MCGIMKYFRKICGELIYTWKTFKLESRLGSNLTFSSGSVTWKIFQVQTWKSPTKHSKIYMLQPKYTIFARFELTDSNLEKYPGLHLTIPFSRHRLIPQKWNSYHVAYNASSFHSLPEGTSGVKELTGKYQGKTNSVHSGADPSYRGLCKG